MPKRNQMQTYDEMLADGAERKGNRLYKAESSEFVDGQITELVLMTATELAAVADNAEPISLSDTQELKRRAIIYTRSCADTSTIPTFSGYARSMGLSTEALNHHMRTHPNSASSEWLRLVHDSFADTLATAALRNMTNSIVSIFSLKARAGWREGPAQVELIQSKQSLDYEITPEDAEKYARMLED